MQENINIPDSTITTNLSFRNLILMNMQQLTNFPYIEKDFDALTDYELLCLVVKYLNDVIANQNEQNASITRMYESFLELQTYVNNTKDTLEDAFNNLDNYVRNYFDNLDVQDEINNKLDEMLEDGVLEQIIEQFIQSTAIWCFDTVADMKQATNLINESYVKTLGYYSINDEGGSLYKITNEQSLTEYQEELNNGLYATLIIKDAVNVTQFGAKGDNNINNNEQNILRKALNCGANKIVFGKNKTYYIKGYEDSDADWNSTSLKVNSNTEIDLNGSTIKVIPNARDWYRVFDISLCENVIIKNGYLYGDINDHTGTTGQWGYGIFIFSSSNITVENMTSSDFWGDSINLDTSINTLNNYCKNITIKNCLLENSRRQGISILSCDGVVIEDCTINNIGTISGHSPKSGIDIEPYVPNAFTKNIIIQRCKFSGNATTDIVASHLPNDDVTLDNIIIKDCIFNDSISINDVFNYKFENNVFKNQKYVSLCLFDSMEFNNNDVQGNVGIYTHSSSNDSYAIIENNNFKSNVQTTDGTMIFIYDPDNTPTGYKGKLYFINNILRGTNDANGRINGIRVQNNATLQLVNIDSNDIKFVNRGIDINGIPCIVNNNKITRGVTPSQFVGDEIKVITNNLFYQSSVSNMAPWILDVKAKNLLLKHNTYYPICLNSNDNLDQYVALTRWINSAQESSLSGYSKIDDNTILTNITT